jgi:hypothetical protein
MVLSLATQLTGGRARNPKDLATGHRILQIGRLDYDSRFKESHGAISITPTIR